MHARNPRLSARGDWLIFYSRLTSLICFLSPLLAEQLASSQSTQGHLIINQRKTLLGKVNCRVCVWVPCGHFLDYLAVLVCCLPLWAPPPLCLWRYRQGDSDQQWIPKSSWKLPSSSGVCGDACQLWGAHVHKQRWLTLTFEWTAYLWPGKCPVFVFSDGFTPCCQ